MEKLGEKRKISHKQAGCTRKPVSPFLTLSAAILFVCATEVAKQKRTCAVCLCMRVSVCVYVCGCGVIIKSNKNMHKVRNLLAYSLFRTSVRCSCLIRARPEVGEMLIGSRYLRSAARLQAGARVLVKVFKCVGE